MKLYSLIFLSLCLLAQGSTASAKEKSNAQQCHFDNEREQSIEKIRGKTHSTLCSAVAKIDSWFGKDYSFDDKQFGGKLIVGFRQDEQDGFDPKVRIRINANLPNLNKKAKAFIGRTDENAFISDSKLTGIDGLANDLKDEEASWLIGLGYSNPSKTGFSTSIGAKISSGFRPYVKARYRYYKNLDENKLLRLSQTLFWRDDEGVGTTSNAEYNYVLNEKTLLAWNTGATYRRDTSIWNTGTSLTYFRKLTNQKGMAYKAYIYGEHGGESEVSLPEYGVSVSYRQPFLRPWLALKASIENRWSKENSDESRESYAKLGIQLEMKFGNYRK